MPALGAAGLAVALIGAAAAAHAESRGRGLLERLEQALVGDRAQEPAEGLVDALAGGEIHLDLRSRLELANADGSEHAEAITLRTRLGYGTKPWYGFSVFGEFENIVAADEDAFFDGVHNAGSGKTLVADPEDTELNQAYLKYANPELFGSSASVGRERITLDDQRFIGNVGWRQNEQTYDAATFRTSLGIEDLSFLYGYLWEIHRIFGDQGPNPTRDWDSDSHLINLSYTGLSWLRATVFAYILDFGNAPGNSSNSFGFRLTGDVPLDDDWKLGYAASYASQTDGSNNPSNYWAHYYRLEASAGTARWGALGFGYEVLGSDGGVARFVTPLATAHQFNGWADVFLDNGGVNGLRDAYAYVAPALPWGLEGRVVYHHFEADHGDDNLGDEIDAVISRSFLERFTALAKVAYYNSPGGTDPVDRYRFWLQLSFQL